MQSANYLASKDVAQSRKGSSSRHTCHGVVARLWCFMVDCGNNCNFTTNGRDKNLYRRGADDYDRYLCTNSVSCRLLNHPWYRNDSCIWKQSIFAIGAKKVFLSTTHVCLNRFCSSHLKFAGCMRHRWI